MENQQPPHLALLPFMAQGHMIPMVDIARLLANLGLTVTIIITPYNHNRIKSTIDRAVASGSNIAISHINLPNTEAGLPEECQSYDTVNSSSDSVKFFNATSMLEPQVKQILQHLKPYPTCLISDMCFPWTTRVAAKLGIPKLVFHGMSCFSLVCLHELVLSNGFRDLPVSSDNEYFVLPGLPDRIEITKAQIKGSTNENPPPEWADVLRQMWDADMESFGTLANTFQELEPEYADELSKKLKGKKVWCIGPVSLCNEDDQDKADRGDKADLECLKWLASHETSSVIYVCLGSMSSVSTSQLVELGLGLEDSGRPFVWVIRNAKEDFRKWLSSQGKKLSEKGLVIQGWAPQVLILSHPSVGGFVTHCGWNSTMEGVTAGLPMLTWPMFAEQFCNEKFVVSVIKTGVRVGVEFPVEFGDEEKVGVQVKSFDITMGIAKLMDGGEEGEERRDRARKLGESAKRAMEEGGSSNLNLARLVQQVVVEKARLARFN